MVPIHAIDKIPQMVQSFGHTRLFLRSLTSLSFADSSKGLSILRDGATTTDEALAKSTVKDSPRLPMPIASTLDPRSVRLNAIDIPSSFVQAREHEVKHLLGVKLTERRRSTMNLNFERAGKHQNKMEPFRQQKTWSAVGPFRATESEPVCYKRFGILLFTIGNG